MWKRKKSSLEKIEKKGEKQLQKFGRKSNKKKQTGDDLGLKMKKKKQAGDDLE